jgi:hypothetical protein
MSISDCPVPGEIADGVMSRVATQYREASKFLALVRGAVDDIEAAAIVACGTPLAFDLRTAVGEQLTWIGKRMGFPRCHCVCDPVPVFGFACGGPHPVEIVGFCEGGSWLSCADGGSAELCFDDDEQYRAHLFARAYQMFGLYDLASLQSAARSIWGPTASVVATRPGNVVIGIGRHLTVEETRFASLSFRALPIAPGIRPSVHLGPQNVFGFGAGWGGLCDGSAWLCPIDIDPYGCVSLPPPPAPEASSLDFSDADNSALFALI